MPRPVASRPPGRPVSVVVPGTSANLGPGFDVLGLALRVYNKLQLTPTPGRGFRITSPISEDSRAGANDLLEQAAELFFRRTRAKRVAGDVFLSGDVPIARGLGSSVTVRLGFLAALDALCGTELSRDDLFQLVTQLEGHPDNAAPAVYGGFTAATMIDGVARHVRFPISPEVRFATLIPPFEVPTSEARKLVPQSFSKADTVHNLGRVGLITAAFASGDLDLLRGAFDDRIHQPYREALIPQLSKVIQAGVKAGAIGGWLSGSGSTIVCMTRENAEGVGAAMLRQIPGSDLRILAADPRGYAVR